MAFDLEQVVTQALAQSPLAGAAVWIAKHYMAESRNAMKKLIEVFESDAKQCREDNRFLLGEVIKLKEKIGG